MHEVVPLWYSSPFPSLRGLKKPIWEWEEIENGSKTANKQTQSVLHCFYKDGSVWCFFWYVWLKKIRRQNYFPSYGSIPLVSFRQSKTVDLIDGCGCVLPHSHLWPLDLILNKQNCINRVLISGQSVLLRIKCFTVCKVLCL